MTAIEPAPNEEKTVGMGIRLTVEQREKLERIARRQCNTVGGIIRLAVQEFVEQEREAEAAVTLTRGRRAA